MIGSDFFFFINDIKIKKETMSNNDVYDECEDDNIELIILIQ